MQQSGFRPDARQQSKPFVRENQIRRAIPMEPEISQN